MKLHYVRLHCALIHELLNLIAANQPAINHQFFASVIRLLPSTVRLAWNSLVDASLLKATSTPLTASLLLIRNKVSFHYDPKELYSFVSRGSNMKGSRFYFADAAAEGYLQSQGITKN